MGLPVFAKVLSRLVSAEKFAQGSCTEEFWLTSSSDVGSFGKNLSELKGNEMVRLGIRRKVKCLGSGDKNNAQNSCSSFMNGFEEKKRKLRDGGDNRGCTGEDEEHEESDNDVRKEEKIPETERILKRKKEVTAEKPILRPQPWDKAKKRIGDTGPLHHRLGALAGKLAPGGKERFQRRHNADGVMEYWLESGDLVNIRNDAGNTNPYWVQKQQNSCCSSSASS